MFYKKAPQIIFPTGNTKGFSLMEILIAIVLLVGVVATFVPNLMQEREKGFINTAKATISHLSDSIESFYLDCKYYPSTDEGLDALVIAPPKCESWGPKPYLKKGKIPKDPWGNDFIYQYDESSGDFEIISLGKGGKPGGEDFAADISSNDI